MLDYARQRIREALGQPRTAVLATSGPAGILAGEFPCEAVGLELYLLLPKTSAHVFNLEHHPEVSLVTPEWELQGSARILAEDLPEPPPELLRDSSAEWCVLVGVTPRVLQIRGKHGWGNLETIDFKGNG